MMSATCGDAASLFATPKTVAEHRVNSSVLLSLVGTLARRRALYRRLVGTLGPASA